jgi:hypothetical protein
MQWKSDLDQSNQISTWNNSPKQISKQIESSQNMKKNATNTQTEGFINGNELQTGYVS